MRPCRPDPLPNRPLDPCGRNVDSLGQPCSRYCFEERGQRYAAQHWRRRGGSQLGYSGDGICSIRRSYCDVQRWIDVHRQKPQRSLPRARRSAGLGSSVHRYFVCHTRSCISIARDAPQGPASGVRWPSLGQHVVEGLSLPGRSILRQDEAG